MESDPVASLAALSDMERAVLGYRYLCEAGLQPDSDGQVGFFSNAWGEQRALDVIARLHAKGLILNAQSAALTPNGFELGKQ